MKFKYYLRGVGIGVLITTIILVIAFSLTGNKMSDKEVIARAKKLGMVMADSTDDNKTVKEDQEEKDTSDKSEAKDSDDAYKDQTKTDAGTGENVDASSEAVQIEVSKGDNPRQVIDKLLEAGLIDDYDTFSHYLHDHGLDSIVYPGTYTINKGSSIEEIATIITTKE